MEAGARSITFHYLLTSVAVKAGLRTTEDLAARAEKCVIAVSGIDPRYGVAEAQEAMKVFGFTPDQVCLSSLAEIGHVGAFLGKSGVLLRCGHGVSAYIKTDSGKRFLVSGWGRVIGDIGSGHWLGRQALEAASRVIDGIASRQEEVFVNKLLQQLDVESAIGLFVQMGGNRAFGGTFGVSRFLTRVGHAAVKLGELQDPFGALLANRAQSAMVDTVASATSTLPPSDRKLRLALRGGLVEEEEYFCKRLVEKLCGELKNIYISEDSRNGEFSPILGAGLLALGLSSAASIEERGGLLIDEARRHDWSGPRLSVLPNIGR